MSMSKTFGEAADQAEAAANRRATHVAKRAAGIS